MPKTDITRAVKELKGKKARYDLLWKYYEGDQPILYAARRLAQTFKAINVKFIANWCAVVVDSTLDRIDLQGFTVNGDEAMTKRAEEVWDFSELDMESDDVHLGTLVCGEAFLIGQPGGDGEQSRAYYNDPRLAAVFYEPDDPHKKRFAAKWWRDGDLIRLNLYYPGSIEKYEKTVKKGSPIPEQPDDWTDLGTEKSDSETIPVFHFRRERRTIASELENVVTLQDAVNKLMADMMVSAEFGAFRQRYIISQMDIGDLKNAPGVNWLLPAGDGTGQNTEVGQFDAEDLMNFINAIERLTNDIAVVSRTPRHYLLQQGGDPSGESLIAMEAPLVKKCDRYVGRFGATWKEAMAFMLGVDPKETDITPVFAPTQTVQPLTQSQIRINNTSAGLPLKTVLRDEGWTEKELEAMEKDVAEADERNAQNTARTAELGVKSFNRGSEA